MEDERSGYAPQPGAPITIVAGHYGVGKTNFALNLAFDWAAAGIDVTLVDLDVVNPYFRSSDYREALEQAGVRVIAPVFAGTNLDSPSLSGAIAAAIEDAGVGTRSDEDRARALIIDAGGDDVGATALGRFAPALKRSGYELWYVVNHYRNLTQTPEEAAAVLHEIEDAAHVRATAVVNNSHLKEDTTAATIREALPFGQQVAEALNVPLLCTTLPKVLLDRENDYINNCGSKHGAYPVQIYVRTPWE